MDSISLSQQAISSPNIPTDMRDTGVAEGKFKTRKTDRFFVSVRKSFESSGDRIKTEFSSFQEKVKKAQVKDAHWFNFLDSKGSLDSESSEKFYQGKLKEFCKCYEDALTAYVAEKTDKHFPYLKGYQEDKPHQYSFRTEERGEGKPFVTIPTMPRTFRAFSEQLSTLLAGHGKSGSLATHLKKSFQSLGVSFDTLTGETWLVRLKVSKPHEVISQKVQTEACVGENRSSPSHLVRSDSDEKVKRHLIEEIKKLCKANEVSLGLCRISKRFADLHKCYDKVWEQPAELPDYEFYQAIGIHDDGLEKLGKETLLATQRELFSKNELLLKYITLIWESFPSSHDDRQLIKFDETYTITQVVESALEILLQPEQRRFESVKLRLFSSRYEQEVIKRELLHDALLELKAAGDSLKGYEGYENAAENSTWFMNLVGECLRQGMPECLFKLGKIKVSSGFRKIWKEKLMEWNIERSDKPSSTPNIMSKVG